MRGHHRHRGKARNWGSVAALKRMPHASHDRLATLSPRSRARMMRTVDFHSIRSTKVGGGVPCPRAFEIRARPWSEPLANQRFPTFSGNLDLVDAPVDDKRKSKHGEARRLLHLHALRCWPLLAERQAVLRVPTVCLSNHKPLYR